MLVQIASRHIRTTSTFAPSSGKDTRHNVIKVDSPRWHRLDRYAPFEQTEGYILKIAPVTKTVAEILLKILIFFSSIIDCSSLLYHLGSHWQENKSLYWGLLSLCWHCAVISSLYIVFQPSSRKPSQHLRQFVPQWTPHCPYEEYWTVFEYWGFLSRQARKAIIMR